MFQEESVNFFLLPSVLSRYKILCKIDRYILSRFNFVVARFSVSKALLLGRRPVVSPPLHISHRDELRSFTHDLLPFLHPGSMSPETGVRGGESVVHRHVGKNRTFSKIALNKEEASNIV